MSKGRAIQHLNEHARVLFANHLLLPTTKYTLKTLMSLDHPIVLPYQHFSRMGTIYPLPLPLMYFCILVMTICHLYYILVQLQHSLISPKPQLDRVHLRCHGQSVRVG